MEFEQLSDKIIFEIFTHLDYDSFLNASTVCLRWNKIIEDNIDFFTSFFADEDEEGEEEQQDEGSSKKRKADQMEEQDLVEEQRLVVQQINACKPNQYHELLGVSEEAEESEVRSQYKKLALMVHPDKNKQTGADKAFQTLKRAFDALMSGVDPESPDTCKVDCPDPSCTAVVYMSQDKYNLVIKGMDISLCRVCKQKFGRVFCTHCFAAWTMVLNADLEGTLAMCSVCSRQFAINFPKPAPKQIANNSLNKKPMFKKKKKNWWEAPK